MKRLVLGVGISSAATSEEVAALAADVMRGADLSLGSVTSVATRERFVADPRLVLGPEVVGVSDERLLSGFPIPGDRTRPGLQARVAEGCALAIAGARAELLVARTPSAHVTMALAQGLAEEIS